MAEVSPATACVVSWTDCACSLEPLATCPDVDAMPWVACLACSAAVASTCEALATSVAVLVTSPISPRRLPTILDSALPSASFSDLAATSTVRSPAAIRSAALTVSVRYSRMSLYDLAMSPTSSEEVTFTSTVTSPTAICTRPFRTALIPVVMPRDRKKATAASSAAAMTVPHKSTFFAVDAAEAEAAARTSNSERSSASRSAKRPRIRSWMSLPASVRTTARAASKLWVSRRLMVSASSANLAATSGFNASILSVCFELSMVSSRR